MTHIIYSDISIPSFLFFVLSLVMLRIVISNRLVLSIIGIGYLIALVLVGMFAQMKWVLAGSLIFMVVSMVITLWIIFKQSRQCFNALKEKEITDGD